MKNSLFEILMIFFDQHVSQLTDSRQNNHAVNPNNDAENTTLAEPLHVFASAKEQSMRIFVNEERLRLTKASYQFIMRMIVWKIISPPYIEQVLEQLLQSNTSFITLNETKWTIRSVMANHLNALDLAFLDLVLYQEEDNLTRH
jgi:uncharacterized protein Smg (DUF494 family)